MIAAAVERHVTMAESQREAIHGARIIVSAVTAAASTDVAREAASNLMSGQIFADLNSVSPGTKRTNAKLIEGAGGHYVDVAVMAPIPPYGLKVPILLGGPAAADLAAAEASVQTADLNLSFTRVTAPLAGRVSYRRLAPGSIVSADTTVLTTIVTETPIRFLFDVPESALLKYDVPGNSVTISFPALTRSGSISDSSGYGPTPSIPFSECSVMSMPGGTWLATIVGMPMPRLT